MSQVNFFILHEELSEFLLELTKKGFDFLIENELNDRTKDYSLIINGPIFNSEHIFLIRSDLYDRYSEALELQRKPYKHTLFDHPVIELSFPRKLGVHSMISGRISAKIGWLDNSADNKIFLSSYRQVERLIKKKCSKIDGFWWVSDKVKEWSSRNNGQLFFGDERAYSRTIKKEEL